MTKTKADFVRPIRRTRRQQGPLGRNLLEGQPTVAQQGTTGVAAGVHKIDELREALHRARALDAEGKESECMKTVRHAKELAKP